MYVDDDEGHSDDKDVDINEKPNADKMLTIMRNPMLTKILTIMRPNADKADHDDKVEKEAEERLAAAAAAEEGEGGGPQPPTKVKARHAKKLAPAYILPWKKKITNLYQKQRKN